MSSPPSAVAKPAPTKQRFARDPLLVHSLVDPLASQANPGPVGVGSVLRGVWERAWPGVSVVELAVAVGMPLGAVLVAVQELLEQPREGGVWLALRPAVSLSEPAGVALARRLDRLAPAGSKRHAAEKRSGKLVIAGGPTAGKERLLASVAGGEVARLETLIPSSDRQEHRRVEMGFARCVAGGDAAVLVVATPSVPVGERFLWRDVARGAVGVVVAVDADRPGDALPALAACREQGLAHVVAVTSGCPRPERVEEVGAALALEPDIPTVAVDPGEPGACLAALAALAHTITTGGRA
ncbi:hypothetical protein [Salinactinospora qingdaonensis]